MVRDARVVIVGAGPVGLTLACELAIHGVVARVVERGQRQSLHSRATVLWPRILELLDRTGAAPDLLAEAQQVAVAEFHNNGTLHKRIDLADLADSHYPFALTLPQAAIEAVLERRFVDLGGTVERAATVVGVAQDAEAVRVSLQLTDGPAETAADWLIGADGASSTVRGKIGCAFPGFPVPIRFMLADADVSSGLKKGAGGYHFGAEGSLATVPIGNGDMFRIAAAMPEDAREEIDAEFLEQLLLRRSGLKCSIESVVNTAFFHAQVRQAPSYRFGRVFIAGDAAHLTTPASGQGMNTGIQDAVALGWRLAGVLLGRLDEVELDAYSAERRAAVDHVQQITTAQTEVVDSENGTVGAVPLMGARQISQLDTVYPGVGDFPAAGARVPLPFREQPDPVRPTLAVTGPTVLMWPGTEWSAAAWNSTTTSAVDGVPAHVRVVDLAGKAPGHLASIVGEEPVAVTVRPDGHVANRCAPDAAVAELRSNSPWFIHQR